jgi:hypothetical protein
VPVASPINVGSLVLYVHEALVSTAISLILLHSCENGKRAPNIEHELQAKVAQPLRMQRV